MEIFGQKDEQKKDAPKAEKAKEADKKDMTQGEKDLEAGKVTTADQVQPDMDAGTTAGIKEEDKSDALKAVEQSAKKDKSVLTDESAHHNLLPEEPRQIYADRGVVREHAGPKHEVDTDRAEKA